MIKRLALIGADTSKSPSDILHSMLFELNGVSATYEKINLSVIDKSVCQRLFKDFDGFNVTMPHKQSIIPFLSGIKTDIGAVNTVGGDGIGYNTDIDGARRAIFGYYKDFGGRVLILGFGGVSKAFLSASSHCKVTVAVRDILRAEDDFKRLLALAPAFRDGSIKKPEFVKYGEITPQYDYVINATSVGYTSDIQLVSDDVIRYARGVYDAVYGKGERMLSQQCKALDTEYHDGLSMLVYQAAFAQKIWFNRPVAEESELNIIQKELLRYL